MRTFSPNHRRRAGGFTLVELLVVIGIIAILISLLLPALNKVRAQARTTQCASNMRQLALGVLQYTDRNKGVLMPARVIASTSNTIYPGGFFWADELAAQGFVPVSNAYVSGGSPINTDTVFKCPEGIDDTVNFSTSYASYPTDQRNNVVYKVADQFFNGATPTTEQWVIPTWYMLNAKPVVVGKTEVGATKDTPFQTFVPTDSTAITSDAALRSPLYKRNISEIRRASEVAMIFEGNASNTYVSISANMTWQYMAARHGSKTNSGKDGNANVAYFDGHVSLVSTAPWTAQAITAVSPNDSYKPPVSGTIVYMSDQ